MRLTDKTINIIKDSTDPSMTRMEAWKSIQSESLDIPWEEFKRIAGYLKLKFRQE